MCDWTGAPIIIQLHFLELCFFGFQEERQRTKGDKGDGDTESSCGAISDMPIASIRDAELGVEPIDEQPIDQGVSHLLVLYL